MELSILVYITIVSISKGFIEDAKKEGENMVVEYDEVEECYIMPSETDRTVKEYEVYFSRQREKWICNCKNWCISKQYRGYCKHIGLVLYYLERKKQGVNMFVIRRSKKVENISLTVK